jgi:lipoprotein-anchoring transpeptidase ErfK/SrfK
LLGGRALDARVVWVAMRRTLILTCAVLAVLAPAARAQTAPAPPTQPQIAAGVSAAGTDVSGLTLDQAAARIYAASSAKLGAPISTHVAGRSFPLAVSAAKLELDVNKSARRAYNAGKAPHSGAVDVPLYITYDKKAVSAYASKVASSIARAPRDATVKIGLSKITKVSSREGLALDADALAKQVTTTLTDPSAARVISPKLQKLTPKVTTGKLASAYGTIITVDRGAFTLRLFKGLKLSKTYKVAVGQAAYPTPTGRYSIQNKAVNPTWSVPNSPWAGALANETVPGGSDANPLKARWMGIVNGVGIHGTDEDGSIGTRASHGCIRMHISDVIDLYPRVPVGTPVLIGD